MSDEVLRAEAAAAFSSATPGMGSGRLPRTNWRNALCFLIIHLLLLLAFIPWLFSWTGVLVCFASGYVFGVLGINIGYHRLLTHRGFSCPRWLECTLAIFGACSIQDSPSYWVAIHRRHHHLADEEADPHSPLRGFLWAHVGWLLVESDHLDRGDMISTYAKDLATDPFYQWLRKSDHWIFVALLSWPLFFLAGYAVSITMGSTATEAVQLGLSWLVWGAFVRTVLVWHETWSVNSVTHLWGYRNYETTDQSRNNGFVGIITSGEGWHNNHHADPRSARHGHKWWELDVCWLVIRVLMMLGLASDVALPSTAIAEALRARAARKNTA